MFWNTYGGAIYGCPLAGCPDSGPSVLAEAGEFPAWLVRDHESLYFVTHGDSGLVESVDDLSGHLTIVAHARSPWTVAVDDRYVYWAEPAQGTVNRCEKSGCARPTVLASGQLQPGYVAEDEISLFWGNSSPNYKGNGNLMRLAK